jgi:hypothetical protein
MSAIELSLLPYLGRETVCLPIILVLLHIALAYQAQTQKHTIPNVVFVQINVVIQGAGAQGNDGTMIDGKGDILRGGGAHIRGGRAHFRGGGMSPPSPLTLSSDCKPVAETAATVLDARSISINKQQRNKPLWKVFLPRWGPVAVISPLEVAPGWRKVVVLVPAVVCLHGLRIKRNIMFDFCYRKTAKKLGTDSDACSVSTNNIRNIFTEVHFAQTIYCNCTIEIFVIEQLTNEI